MAWAAASSSSAARDMAAERHEGQPWDQVIEVQVNRMQTDV